MKDTILEGHHFEGRHFEGRHFEGHHFEGHHFEGHHFEGHHFEGHHFEGHHFEGTFIFKDTILNILGERNPVVKFFSRNEKFKYMSNTDRDAALYITKCFQLRTLLLSEQTDTKSSYNLSSRIIVNI